MFNNTSHKMEEEMEIIGSHQEYTAPPIKH